MKFNRLLIIGLIGALSLSPLYSMQKQPISLKELAARKIYETTLAGNHKNSQSDQQLMHMAQKYHSLSIPMLTNESLIVLAQRLLQPHYIDNCLINGSYNLNLTPEVTHLLAQEMLKQMPGLKNRILLKQMLRENNGVVPHKELATNTSVHSASFSPDGTQMVTASTDNTARIWDVRSGAQLHRLISHDDWVVRSAIFSPDGTQIVTPCDDRTARIWDVKSGAQLHCLTGHTKWVSSASFSPDGTQIVTASSDTTARIWDVRSGAQLHCLGHDDWVKSASFSPDGTQIVTASHDNTARIWDVKSGAQLHSLTGHTDWVSSANFSPDGTQIVTASSDTTARIWDVKSGAQLHCLTGHTHWVGSASFSSDGTQIVTASSDNTARIWDVRSGAQLHCLTGHSDRISSASFSPDGTQIVTASNDKTARIWDVRSGAQLHSLTGHTKLLHSASFSPDGTQIVTVSSDKTARIWAVADSSLAQWFAKEIKPEQVAVLAYLDSCLDKKQAINTTQYPAASTISIPEKLKKLTQPSFWQRTKNKWSNLNAYTRYGIGITAAAATAYGAYTIGTHYKNNK
jgi:WD40 repeat protein